MPHMDARSSRRASKAAAERGPSLVAHYRPLPDVRDEMVDASGAPRPAWRQFIAALDGLGTQELTRRFARADQYLRDAPEASTISSRTSGSGR